MFRAVVVLLAVLSPAGAPGAPYVEQVVGGWRTSPVYVDASARSLVPDDDAARLAVRVDTQSPPVRIAVVPAAALGTVSGSTREQQARAFTDALVDRAAADGVYLVVFGGAIVWGSAVGTDAPVADVLTDELGKHTRSEPVALLDAVLTRLGVPSSPGDDGRRWVTPVLVGGLALLALFCGFGWWRARRQVRGRGGGPAPYRPSYDVLPDEADTVAERRALAVEDVTRFGEELDAADLDIHRPAVAGHVQAAMDAYADAGRLVDDRPGDDDLRVVRSAVEYGRWRLACGLAVLADEPLPARRSPCFFDPAHGRSVADWTYTPDGGKAREIPVCASCRDELDRGEL